MSFYYPAPCPICGMDIDDIRHVPHGLMTEEAEELHRLQRLFVAHSLGITHMVSADRDRLQLAPSGKPSPD